MQHYSLRETIEKTTEVVRNTTNLHTYEAASTVLPPDTVFALVANFMERDSSVGINYQWFTGPLLSIGHGIGIEGLTTGYVSHNGTVLRIHNGQTLTYEQPMQNVRIRYDNKFGYIIDGPQKSFLLLSGMPIEGAEGHFASQLSSERAGWGILFNQLQAQGAQVNEPSSRARNISLIIWSTIIIALAVLLLMWKS